MKLLLLAHAGATLFMTGLIWFVQVVRPANVPPAVAWAGFALLAAVWLSTALLQAPRHAALGEGFDRRRARVSRS